MGFKTDGSSHRDGVLNEHNVITLVNEHPNMLPIRQAIGECITHKGGTKTTADAVGIDSGVGISIKRHKNSCGTFDYLNTTKFEISERIKSIDTFIKKHRKSINPEYMREAYKQLCNQILKTIDYGAILHNLACEYSCTWIIIHCCSRRQLVLFSKDELSRLWSQCSGCQIKNECMSGKLLGTQGLRVRVCLNNGVSKVVNGETSIFSLKIQQDQVEKFISSLKNPIVCDY